jgi:hypothetical protein
MSALLGIPLGEQGSARQRYAVAMGLYQAGQIGAAVLEAYRIAAAHDRRDPAQLLEDFGLELPGADPGGAVPGPTGNVGQNDSADMQATVDGSRP